MLHHHHDPLQRHMHSQYAQQGDANLSSSATNSPVMQPRRGSNDTSLSSSRATTTATPPQQIIPSQSQQTTTLPGSVIIELATPHNANVTFDDASENFTPMERDVPNVQSGVPGAGRPSGLMGHLRITLHSARDLIHDDSERALRRAQRQDPYVIMSCGRESIKSRVEKEAGTDPVWDETVLFTLSGREDVLHIRVWDQRFLADRGICRVDLPLTQIVHKRGPIAYQMVDDKDLTRNLGIITLTVVYIPLDTQQSRQPTQQQQQQRVGTGAATGAALGTGAGLAAGSHLPRTMDKDRDGRPDILERDRNHDGIADRNQALPQPTMGERAKAALIPGRNAHEQAAIDHQGQGLATGSGVGYAGQSSALPRTLDRDGDGRVDAFERDRTHPVATSAALGTGAGLAAGSHHRHHRDHHDQTLPPTTYARTGDAVPRSEVLPTAGAGALGAGAMDRNHDGIPDSQQGYTSSNIPRALDRDGNGRVDALQRDRNHDGIDDRDQGLQPTMGQKIKAALIPGRTAEEQAMIDAQKQQGYGGEQQMMGRDSDPNISRPLAAGALAGTGAGYMAGSTRDRNYDGIPDSQQGYTGTSSHLPRAVDRDQDGRLDAFERGHQTPYGTMGHGTGLAGTGAGLGAGLGAGTGLAAGSHLPRALDRDRDGHMDAFERDRNHNGIPDRQEGLSHSIQTHPMSNTISGAGTAPQPGYTSSNLPRSLDRDGDGRVDAFERNHHPGTFGTGLAAGTGTGTGAGLGAGGAGAAGFHDRNHDGIDDRQQQGYTSSNLPRALDRDGNGRVDALQRDRNHDGIDDRDQGLQPTMGQKIKAALIPGRTSEEQAIIDAQRQQQQQGYSGTGYGQGGTLGAGGVGGGMGATGSMDRNHDGIPDNQQGYADQGTQPTMGQKIKAAFTGRSAEEQAMIDAQKQQGYGGEQQMMERDGDPNISRPLAAGALAGTGASYMAGSTRDRNHDGIPDSQQGYTGTSSHLPRAVDRDQDGRLDAFERGHQTPYGTTGHGTGVAAGTGTGTGFGTSSHLPHGTTSHCYDAAAMDRERAYGHIRDRSAILANVPIDSMDPMVRWTNTDSGTYTTSSHLPRALDRDQDGRLDAFERGLQTPYGTSGTGLATGIGAGMGTSSNLPRSLDRDRDGHMDAFERDRNYNGIPDRQEGLSHGIQTHPMSNTITGAGTGAGLAAGSYLPRAMDKDRDGRPDILERDRNNDGIADRNQGMTSSHVPQFLDKDRDGRMDMFERDRGHGLDQGQYPTAARSIGTGTSESHPTASYTMPIAQPIHSESQTYGNNAVDMPPQRLPTTIQSHLPARASPITVPERVPYVSENPMVRSPQTAPAPNVVPARHGLNETQSLQDALREGPQQQQQYPTYQTQQPY